MHASTEKQTAAPEVAPAKSTELTTCITVREGVQVVEVSGALDTVAYDSFRDLLTSLLGRRGARIVLDCTKLFYVNSQGLALFIRLQTDANRNGAFLGITGLNRRIVRTLEMLGMTGLVKLYETAAEALAAAAAS